MPEVIFNGPEGRLEGRYHHSKVTNAPIALLLHPHPQHGGTMNNKVVHTMFQTFVKRGFSVLRFNFRGVGRSQGIFDNGPGELSDAAAAIDWMQTHNANSSDCWIGGFSFGAWISMQLMMRRPEINGFISIAPPASLHDFSFLAPCPSSGMIIHGSTDDIIPIESVDKLAQKVSAQKNIKIDYRVIDGGDHFFAEHIDILHEHVEDYLDKALKTAA
jgi:alpha/beta superfamily hydrolase